jgi:hypothetical protein
MNEVLRRLCGAPLTSAIIILTGLLGLKSSRSMNMKRSMAIFTIIGTLAFALPAIAQNENSVAAQVDANNAELGRVEQGNTTIVFKPADTSDIDTSRLQTWGEFAEGHPKVAKALAYNSSLMNDHAYLSKHPELHAFFEMHPDIKEAMAENPGSFVAIQPRPGE